MNRGRANGTGRPALRRHQHGGDPGSNCTAQNQPLHGSRSFIFFHDEISLLVGWSMGGEKNDSGEIDGICPTRAVFKDAHRHRDGFSLRKRTWMWEKDSYWFRFGRRGLHVRKQFGMRALPPLCGVWSTQLPANAAESVDGEHSP